ncbi:MAG: glycosyltransferase 87 family protein [Pseudonocardiaceae bacterium]
MSTENGLLGRTPPPVLSGALLVLTCAAVALATQVNLLLDLAVYQAGGQAWLDSRPLYEAAFPVRPDLSLPFTYPPFAALCFSVLALVPHAALAVVFSVGSFVALLVAVRATGTALWRDFGWPHAVLIGCLAVALEPVWKTLMFGQVNLYLMAIVAVDLLAVRSGRYRGFLIGLAAAIKLTPAVFLLYLAVGRQWRAIVNAVAAFAACTALAALIHPADSATYWFTALLAPERIGGLAYTGNQSMRGALHRLGLNPATELTWWVVAGGLVIVLGGLAARRWRHAGQDAPALIAVAMVGLLVSPVAWSHHWVWLVPALLVLAYLAMRRRSKLLAATTGLVAVAALVAAHQFLPQEGERELSWSAWQHLLGNSYLWLGLLMLVVLLALRWTPRPTQAPERTIGG